MKKCAIAVCLLVIIFAFSSCQVPAPSGLQGSALPQVSPSYTALQPGKAESIPGSLALKIVSDGGACTIDINAKITYAKSGDYPVLRAQPEAFTQEAADRMIQYFLGNAGLYKPKDPSDKNKEYITSVFGNNQEGGNALRQIYACADREDGNEALINIKNKLDSENNCLRADGDIILNMYKNVLSASGKNGQTETTGVTPVAAKDKAEDILADLGIKDIAAQDVQYGSQANNANGEGYLAECHRVINGITVTEGYIPLEGENQGSEINTHLSDEILIGLDSSGTTRFSWYNKCRIVDTVSHNAELFSFDQITSVVENEFKNKYGWVDGIIYKNQNANLTINIDKISLEYKCIPIKGDTENLKLVPVWNFYGTSVYQDADKTLDGYYGPSGFCTYLCINALDGAVIKSNDYIE